MCRLLWRKASLIPLYTLAVYALFAKSASGDMGERQINFGVNVAVKRMQTDEWQVTARAFQIMRFGNTRHSVRGNQFNRKVKLRTGQIIHPQNSDAAYFHQTGKARGRLGREGVFMRDQPPAVASARHATWPDLGAVGANGVCGCPEAEVAV